MEEKRVRQMNTDVVDIPEEQVENEERERVAEKQANRAAPTTMDEALEPLFEENESQKFRAQWLELQGKFVDNPRESVREADELVAGVLKSVTMGFHDRRTSLEKQWNSGDNVSTEDLRMALKRYRSFFDRLLTLES
jgi:hypothetical protein